VVLYDREREDREAISRGIAQERGAVLVPPYDDPLVIAGQGTVGREIAEEIARLGHELDCVIVNAFAAETGDAKRFIVNTMRGLFTDKRTLYFKRHYRDGRTRPTRLNVNDFVADHLARSSGTRRASPRSSDRAARRNISRSG